ncbi:MAG: PilT/PilU family type 4a pilus ATPase [bacterium]|nr:PilT/PilU family type 4a pilus ATPase [bacterium]
MSGREIPEDEASFRNVRKPQPNPAATPGMGLPPDSAQPQPQQPQQPQAPEAPQAAPRAGATPTAQPGSKSNPAAETKSGTPAKKFQHPTGSTHRERMQKLAATSTSPRHQVEAWLAVMVKSDASDLILRASGRPSQRVGGKISFLPGRVPGPGPLGEVLRGVLGERRMQDWERTGSADAAIQLDGLGRFRINAYKQMGEPAVVIRRIGEKPPNIDQLGLPGTELKELSMRKRGLVLVTGIAGSGKSTTLAAMIQHMNETVERHIVTLEDPVELLFSEKKCVISQREVGTDTTCFNDGLRHALRQSPDVILIGEVRDAETVIAALEATETGHMVMSTMHTVNAPQTMDRILGFFPAERHRQIRQRIADNLAGVLSQRLVPKIGGGLVPAFELMIPTPHVRELLDEGQTSEMARVIESGTEAGLVSFNECLRGLVERQQVDLPDALAASDRPDELLLALRGIRGSADRVAGPSTAGQAPKGPRSSSGDGPDGLRMASGR